jgi:2-polyprenyl-6-methoxyphenol hydroxylase-like FAD-dependent oxidoreductase
MLHTPFCPVSYISTLNICFSELTRQDQGQGGGIAMEDAATLAVVLPSGTSPEEVPERLKLYEEIRYKRANTIQEFSRQAGKDYIDGKPQIDSK